jgi:hypothetical protein
MRHRLLGTVAALESVRGKESSEKQRIAARASLTYIRGNFLLPITNGNWAQHRVFSDTNGDRENFLEGVAVEAVAYELFSG